MNRFASFRMVIATPRALALLAAMSFGALSLGGCSTTVEDIGSTAVDPAKFTFYKCPDLIRHNTAMLTREKELRQLMEKAETSASGQFVSALAYQSEYLSVRGDLNLIQKVAVEKNCDIPKRNSDRAIH